MVWSLRASEYRMAGNIPWRDFWPRSVPVPLGILQRGLFYALDGLNAHRGPARRRPGGVVPQPR